MNRLGFGLMRLPLCGGSPTDIDLAALCQMVDLFLERGFTYFDTSYVTMAALRNTPSARRSSSGTTAPASFWPPSSPPLPWCPKARWRRSLKSSWKSAA